MFLISYVQKSRFAAQLMRPQLANLMLVQKLYFCAKNCKEEERSVEIKISNSSKPLPALDLLPKLMEPVTPRILDGTPADSKDHGPKEKPAMARKRSYKRILVDTNAFIEEISHMDEVRDAQNKVIQLKDRLIESGENKRNIFSNLSAIRRELDRIHSDISNTGRGTERLITLIRDEMQLLKAEKQLQVDYDAADEIERNLFTQLTASINDSYEKEKLHSNTLRLWGIIGTIITSVITLVLSTVGHYYHTTQLGLVGTKFTNADNISKDINDLRDIIVEMKQQNERKLKEEVKNAESWSSYFSRHTSSVYRYFFPKK